MSGDRTPLVLLMIVVLASSLTVAWYMKRTVAYERLAVRQELAEAQKMRLAAAGSALQRFLDNAGATAVRQPGESPRQQFNRIATGEPAAAAVVLGEHGTILYPDQPFQPDPPRDRLDAAWAAAIELETHQEWVTAAGEFESIARSSPHVDRVAQAYRAQARCLLRAGKPGIARTVLFRDLITERLSAAVDQAGRLIVPDARLTLLPLLGDGDEQVRRRQLEALVNLLRDYTATGLKSPQRLFLMKRVMELDPALSFPTLDAEELALRYRDSGRAFVPEQALARTPIEDVWQLGACDGKAILLFREPALMQHLNRAILRSGGEATGEILLMRPGAAPRSDSLLLPAGELLPGWHLAIEAPEWSDQVAHRVAVYLWSGAVVIGLIGGAGVLAMALIRRRMHLARLRNDLVATVSHELRTPLASTRLLVETLLGTEAIPPEKTREYLQVILRENERLCRLVERFLTFSRLEQNRYRFGFRKVTVAELVARLRHELPGRVDLHGYDFDIEVQTPDACLCVDPDAINTALLNLIENAVKYSGDDKWVRLRISGAGPVLFHVEDHGTGIPAAIQARIFRRFYQVDQRLSRRQGGCGLGLSIVEYIMRAHRTRITVKSTVGSGSTFSFCLPRDEA